MTVFLAVLLGLCIAASFIFARRSIESGYRRGYEDGKNVGRLHPDAFAPKPQTRVYSAYLIGILDCETLRLVRLHTASHRMITSLNLTDVQVVLDERHGDSFEMALRSLEEYMRQSGWMDVYQAFVDGRPASLRVGYGAGS